MLNNVVFEIRGKEYSIINSEKNNIIFIDYQKDKKAGDEIIFPRVLNIGEKFGKPYLDGAFVIGKVLKHRMRKKIIIFKYKAKKRFTKKQGFRPRYTEVQVLSIKE